jgi:DNA-binding transcriptional LysR family regulator
MLIPKWLRGDGVMDWTDRIGRRLKPRDLHVFLAVAETGSMAKAAETLSCSRPVVSKTIAELEATLGVTLLDRTAHGVEPTRYGQALLARSVAVFDELRKSVKEIEFLAEPGRGELRFGCLEPLMVGLAAEALVRLCKRYPLLRFYTEQWNADAQFKFLRSRKCEVALTRRLPGPAEPEIKEEEMFHERLRIVVSPESPWARRRKIALRDLAGESWILAPHEADPGAPVFEGFRAAGVEMPPVNIFSYSLSLRYSLLARGSFVTAIPSSALEFGALKKWLFALPIDLPPWQRPVVMTTLKDRTLSPAAEAFMVCVRELCRPLR